MSKYTESHIAQLQRDCADYERRWLAAERAHGEAKRKLARVELVRRAMAVCGAMHWCSQLAVALADPDPQCLGCGARFPDPSTPCPDCSSE